MTTAPWSVYFRFQDPLWLLLLIVWALGIFWYRRRKKSTVIFSTVAPFVDIPKTPAQQLLPTVRFAVAAAVALMIIALARPQSGQEAYRVRSEGISMMICLDRSGSMQAMDFFLDNQRVDRFAAVKQIFRDFALGSDRFSGRPDDRMGLVTFGGYVDALCPLTLDHETLSDILDMVRIPEPLTDASGRIISNDILDEESATAIGDALVAAVERLRTSGSKSNVVILLSDGKQNTGAVSAEEAAEIAKTLGVRVYTIGIGSTGIAPFPAYGPDGQKGFVNQPVELDESTLKKIAETTSGQYFNARDTDALAKICAEIDTLEKTVHEERIFTRYRELYRYFLAPGVVLLLIGVTLLRTKFRVFPE